MADACSFWMELQEKVAFAINFMGSRCEEMRSGLLATPEIWQRLPADQKPKSRH